MNALNSGGLMGEASRRRLGIVLRSALAVEVAGVVGAMVTLAESTALKPEYEGVFAYATVVLPGAAVAVPVFVFAVHLRKGTAACWAAASGILALVFVTMLAAAGTGPWIACCAVTLFASYAATLVALFGTQRPPLLSSKAAIPVALVALAWAAWSASGPGSDVDYAGTWTARQGAASLTMNAGDGHYTLQVGTCTEEGEWHLDHPQMSTSVHVWLRREGATCLGGPPQVRLPVAEGMLAIPLVVIPGPDGTELLLTKR
ncbi:hypothetical protein [Streptomyces sp. NPDC090445]|uniref:hypothetical protein n=1 Tax=Streptomyces sp. NPDC090445 TaxID=3365963 RepID=UPI0037FA27B0